VTRDTIHFRNRWYGAVATGTGSNNTPDLTDTSLLSRIRRIKPNAGVNNHRNGDVEEADRAEQGAGSDTLSDRVLDAICLIGPIGRCRDRLAEYRAAGLDLPSARVSNAALARDLCDRIGAGRPSPRMGIGR